MEYLIIYISQRWSGNCFRRHLIKAIAQADPNIKILCIDRPLGLFDSILKGLWPLIKWYKEERKPLKIFENLTIIRPLIILHDHIAIKVPLMNSINNLLMKLQIKHHFKYDKSKTATWIFDPYQMDCLKLLGEKYTIYEMYDDYSAESVLSSIRTKNMIEAKEKQILNNIDVVITVTDVLSKKANKYKTSNVYTISNGVDDNVITNICKVVPKDIANIKYPIIGYWGNLTSRIDFKIIEAILRENDKWNLVIIGKYDNKNIKGESSNNYKGLLKYSNLYYLGHKEYHQLKQYVSKFDVAIIPYKMDDFNRSCSPLKLYEYLATGVPIVATPIPDVMRFSDFVEIGNNTKEFVAKIHHALGSGGKGRKERINIAQENTWDKKANAVLKILETWNKQLPLKRIVQL